MCLDDGRGKNEETPLKKAKRIETFMKSVTRGRFAVLEKDLECESEWLSASSRSLEKGHNIKASSHLRSKLLL